MFFIKYIHLAGNIFFSSLCSLHTLFQLSFHFSVVRIYIMCVCVSFNLLGCALQHGCVFIILRNVKPCLYIECKCLCIRSYVEFIFFYFALLYLLTWLCLNRVHATRELLSRRFSWSYAYKFAISRLTFPGGYEDAVS